MGNLVTDGISCIIHCFENSEIISLMLIILLIILSSIIIYLLSRKSIFMLISQGVGSAFVLLNFIIMNCKMFLLVWFYLAFFIGSLAFLIFIKYSTIHELKKRALQSTGFLEDLESEFDSEIFLLDTQKKRAFTHKKKIFISIGIIELLTEDEIKSVIAHEVYHVKKSPNRLIVTTLALSSLTFIRHDDEKNADRFAAEIAGKENLEKALKKLMPGKWEKRIKSLQR